MENDKLASRLEKFSEWKEKGKVYFVDKQYSDAIEVYAKALEAIGAGFAKNQQTCGVEQMVGSSVLIRTEDLGHCNYVYRSGYIAVANSENKTVDIIFSEELGGVEEEMDDVALDKLVLISPYSFCNLEGSMPNDSSISANICQLQCNVYLNLARCALKLKLNAKAILYTTICTALGNYAAGKRKRNKELTKCIVSRDTWVKAFYFRSKAHLAMFHFKQAKQDAKKMLKVEPSNLDYVKLAALIDRKQTQRMRKDKKLVKLMCKHVQDAMDKSNKGGDACLERPKDTVATITSDKHTPSEVQNNGKERKGKERKGKDVQRIPWLTIVFVSLLAARFLF